MILAMLLAATATATAVRLRLRAARLRSVRCLHRSRRLAHRLHLIVMTLLQRLHPCTMFLLNRLHPLRVRARLILLLLHMLIGQLLHLLVVPILHSLHLLTMLIFLLLPASVFAACAGLLVLLGMLTFKLLHLSRILTFESLRFRLLPTLG